MTTANSASLPLDHPEPGILDVWSRTTPKYRIRAAVLLCVNFLLFVGLCCFAYWLRTGEFFAPAQSNYWALLSRTMTPVPGGEPNLANFVVFPISLDLVPVHGVVVGLLLAALVSIPILIAILYRFVCCLPFVAAVAFVAVMPWLAITLTGSCILASVKPFRFNFRYASALLGLLLVMLYFLGASREPYIPVDAYKPEARIKFIAPWVMATIASCVIMGLVLFLSKLVNYRPGVVAPLLLVSFAVPVAVFELYVGRDELHYRLLESSFQDQFRDRDLGEWFERMVYEVGQSREDLRASLDTVRKTTEPGQPLELDPYVEAEMRTAFARQRADVVADCDWFIRHFPDSRYAPNALYIKGQTLDMRLDPGAFYARKQLRYYTDFPAPASESTWKQTLHYTRQYAPDSSVSAVARSKQALFAARRGEFDDAVGLLTEACKVHEPGERPPAGSDDGVPVQAVLQRKPADQGLRIPVTQVVFDARQFLSLLQSNREDPRYGLSPLCGSPAGRSHRPGLLQLDPRHPRYRTNIEAIAAAYPDCLLIDNLALLKAMLIEPPAERAEALRACLAEYPSGDARAETLLRLGVAQQEAGSLAAARDSLEALLSENPDGPWSAAARDRLRAIALAMSDTTRQ